MTDNNKELKDVVQETVIETLRSLNLLDKANKQEENEIKINEPYVSQGIFSGKNQKGGEFDHLLSDSMTQTLFSVPGAQTPNQNRGRTAASTTPGTLSGLAGGLTGSAGGFFSANPYHNYSLSGYTQSQINPYMTSQFYGSNMYGNIPVYFLMMQEQNGGLLYWPVSVREKYQWLRYFYMTEPLVGQAIDLRTDLPISKLGLSMPEIPGDHKKELSQRILKKCKKWTKHVDLFSKIRSFLHEFNLLGVNYTFCEWSNEKNWWDKLVVLPPEDVTIVNVPFSDLGYASYFPEPIIKLVESSCSLADNDDISFETATSLSPLDQEILKKLPKDIMRSIKTYGSIIMDTDPFSANEGDIAGSFCNSLMHKRSEYADLGVSIVERCIIPLLQKEHCKYTQLSLMSRLMTPRNKISAPGISPEATDYLRSEIDASMQDPDYHVVTNFDFSWEVMGSEARLVQLQPEYERIENELVTALGIPREMLTGEGQYTGNSKVTLEILNTRFVLLRNIIKNFIEEKLFKPMAVANDWYIEEEDENGNLEKTYVYPNLTFNRLSIKDNQESLDILFQLYQNGSVPIQVIYEVFNLDANEMNDLLVDNMFTIKSSAFNELMTQLSNGVTDYLINETNAKDKIVDYLGLNKLNEDGKPLVDIPMDLGEDIFIKPEIPKTKEPGTEEAPKEDMIKKMGLSEEKPTEEVDELEPITEEEPEEVVVPEE